MKTHILFILLLLLAALPGIARPGAGDSVRVIVKPATVYIEKSDQAQHVNFDFVVANPLDQQLLVTHIEVRVFDRSGQLAHRDFVNPYSRTGIGFTPQPVMEARRPLLLFNPFHTFDLNMPLHQLLYEFYFSTEDGKKQYKTTCVVSPVFYQTKTDLILPIKGRVLIWDGHDYTSHHRRFTYLDSFFVAHGMQANFQRYGYDFVVIDQQGTMYRGNPKNPENWYSGEDDSNTDYYGFGVPVYAAGAGRVVDMHDGDPDNRSFNLDELTTREKAYAGNYIIIDHLNGEYSWFGHLKQGSITVKLGQTVKQGEVIGAMGASGDSLFPHLHYELRNGVGAKTVEGLPSYFSRFTRVLGSTKVKVKKGQVNSGNILESN